MLIPEAESNSRRLVTNPSVRVPRSNEWTPGILKNTGIAQIPSYVHVDLSIGFRKRCRKVGKEILTPKLPQSHLIMPSSTHPCHHRLTRTIFSCLTRPAYSRSTSIFSVSSPPKKAISSENSASRECVCLRLPESCADCAAKAPKDGVNARTTMQI